MPKIKTSRTAAKRFSINKNGKVKFKRAYLRHLLSSKSPKQKRQLREAGRLGKADTERVRRMMPNG
ncbi:MAG TPA: 50S ribosomal protein L35 [Candidatus Binataceae bacterium]|nr:50S ribosomal protein L35 [Candidatus Binataceae bacterium]